MEKVGHCVSMFQMSKPTAVVPTSVLLGTKVANYDLMMARHKTEAHSFPAIQYNNPLPPTATNTHTHTHTHTHFHNHSPSPVFILFLVAAKMFLHNWPLSLSFWRKV